MRVLLTGAAGFIGRHVYRRLCLNGHDVVGVDSLVQQVHHGMASTVPIEHLNVRTFIEQRWDSRWRGTYDAVVHLAAEVGVAQSQHSPARYIDANVSETGHLWERIIQRKDVRKVVVASSMSVYGEGEYSADGREMLDAVRDLPEVRLGNWDAVHYAGTAWHRNPEPEQTREVVKVPRPASVYAQTKYDQERYSLLLGEAHNVPVAALRFFNTYGPGQSLSNPYTGFLAHCACRILNGKAPRLYEDGQQQRDFVYVTDVAEAIVVALETPHCQGVLNVCTGIGTTIEAVARLCAESDSERPCDFSVLEPIVLQRYRSGDVRHCVGSPTAFERMTGWRAKESVGNGIRQFMVWAALQPVPTDRSEEVESELGA